MRTIAVIARKGGSGKTTVAVHMAIAAHLRGLKTLLADSDPQRSSSDVLKVRRGPGPAWLETAGPKLFALQVAAQRAAVVLTVYDGLSHAEAARALGCSETTVSWRIFSARRKLKAWLQTPATSHD